MLFLHTKAQRQGIIFTGYRRLALVTSWHNENQHVVKNWNAFINMLQSQFSCVKRENFLMNYFGNMLQLQLSVQLLEHKLFEKSLHMTFKDTGGLRSDALFYNLYYIL